MTFYKTQVVEYQHIARLEEKKLKKSPYALAFSALWCILMVLTLRRQSTATAKATHQHKKEHEHERHIDP